jgi:hypothetical protein
MGTGNIMTPERGGPATGGSAATTGTNQTSGC